MKFLHGVYHIFDRMEDHIRGTLSRHPFIYTFVGGSGVVLFWRGVWHTADILESLGGWYGVLFSSIGSMVLGVLILLATGLFVSIFIGDAIIMSGIKREKKIIDKTIEQVDNEKIDIDNTLDTVMEVKKDVERLETAAGIKN